MAQRTIDSSEVKITSHGYHVYKNTTWVNAKEGNYLNLVTL